MVEVKQPESGKVVAPGWGRTGRGGGVSRVQFLFAR